MKNIITILFLLPFYFILLLMVCFTKSDAELAEESYEKV